MLAPKFFKIIFCVFLILSPVKAMMSDTQEEEILPAVRPIPQRVTTQKEAFSLEPYKEETALEDLPDDIFINYF